MGRVLFVWMLIAAMVLAACGGSDDAAGPVDEPAAEGGTMAGSDLSDGLPEVNPLEVTGDIISAGSSTVFPLSEAMAERFRDEGYAYNITVDSIGSGAGFERFCVAGESDISNASRPIKDSEIESCGAIDRIPIEFRVGTDALAVTVSKDNDFVDNLTMEELALVFSSAKTWADVNPDWPAEPIQRFSPGTDSGTFDYFVEEVFDKDKEPNPQAPTRSSCPRMTISWSKVSSAVSTRLATLVMLTTRKMQILSIPSPLTASRRLPPMLTTPLTRSPDRCTSTRMPAS